MMKILLNAALMIVALSVSANDWPHDNISQAVFAQDVVERTPVDIITGSDKPMDKVFFFTNIRNLTGEIITHRWYFDDEVIATVSFVVKGPRWRLWSSKNMWYRWLGKWRVDVTDSSDNVLLSRTFDYLPR